MIVIWQKSNPIERTIENIWGNVIVFRLCMDWKVQRLVDGTEWGILRRISMDLLNIETRCIFSDFKIQFPFKFYGCSASLLQCEPLVVVSTARCFRNIIIILSEPGVLGDHVTCEIFIDYKYWQNLDSCICVQPPGGGGGEAGGVEDGQSPGVQQRRNPWQGIFSKYFHLILLLESSLVGE